MKSYLERRESEVVDIMITLFSQEEVWDMRERSIRQEVAKEVAIKTMVEDGQEYGATRQDVLKKLKCKFGLSETDAQKMLELYWQK